MKTITSFIIALIILNFSVANAQELKNKIPAASTGQRIEQDFGLGTISVKYYRPNTQGRKIFGNIEPYGLVWRTGANNATLITLTDTVQFEGNTILPGSYSLFSIPGETESTIIFNKNITQWGAYSYDEKQDLLRFKVKPVKLANKVETLSFQFADVQESTALMVIQWENTGIRIHLKTNVEDRIMANIIEAMKGPNKPYFSAVWMYKHNRNLPQALAWMQEADKAQPSFATKYWVSKLQTKTGDKKSAIVSATEGLKIATDLKNAEYIRMNTDALNEAKAK